MIYLKTEEEIELIRESSLLVGKTLAEVAKLIEPGVDPLKLDRVAEEFIRDHGGVPGFKGYNDFPNTLCTSVNSQVVHGIPNSKALKNGDIISVDCGVVMNGFYGDVAYTFEVGEVSEEIHQLLETTKACLQKGIEAAKAGNRIGDIGFAIQSLAEENGYGVVRELVGHGLGKNLHEGPEVPNYGRRGTGMKLKEGLVIAIEPMINLGKKNVKQDADGWTIVTADGLVSAHFEHDIVIRKDKAEVLSTHEYVEEVLIKKKNK
ncbi:MAG: type I methionyl aminopeptidase [Flavobacteriales bacterium]|nr:type I methionyl aminopeptidase [Flavobacteriales bacterium]